MTSETCIHDLRSLLDEIRAENARQLDPITITRLRTRFDQLMAELAKAVEPTREIEDRFAKIKGITSLHQMKWGTCRLLDDPDRYREDSQVIGLLMREFLDWIEQNTETKNGKEPV